MKVASVVLWLSAALAWSACATGPQGSAGSAGNAGSTTLADSTQSSEPALLEGPDDFVLRDIRKSAAATLGCQVPDVNAVVGPWGVSEGNVTAYCRGYEIHYYLRCITTHQCKATIAD